MVADRTGEQLAYILLEEGHLWGEKEVAIRVAAVKYVLDDGVHLILTKQEVAALPPFGGR